MLLFLYFVCCFFGAYKQIFKNQKPKSTQIKPNKKLVAASTSGYIYWRFLKYDPSVDYTGSISSDYLTNAQSFWDGGAAITEYTNCAGLSNGNFVITAEWSQGGQFKVGVFIINQNGVVIVNYFQPTEDTNVVQAMVGSIPYSKYNNNNGGFSLTWLNVSDNIIYGRSYDNNGTAITEVKQQFGYEISTLKVIGISLGGYIV